MDNLILFLNSFLSYLMVFAVFVVCIVCACFAGVSLRKVSNKKAQQEDQDAVETSK
ncbi:MAG: hypothetical protein IJ711_08725 [Lachnospiraceae bacterium]|nr:hypothetical protein [Lachnospiraceae bacterium]